MCFTCIFVLLHLTAVFNPLRDLYWHGAFHRATFG